MGISGLQKFLECNQPNEYCKGVDIVSLVEIYRNYSTKQPVIVIDGSYFLNHFYLRAKYRGDVLCGGQLDSFVSFMKDFVDNLKYHGIKPVFFFCGPTLETNIQRRQVRTYSRAGKIRNIYEKIDTIEDMKLFGRLILPPLISNTGRFMAKYECDCDVFLSVNEYNVDLAAYANREGCFAILSQTTDFMCLKNAHYYLSIRYLDLEQLTTLSYNRFNLMNHLQLDFNQMRLFASLAGNEIVPLPELKCFHKNICETEPTTDLLVHKLATYVKEKTLDRSVEDALPDVLSDLSEVRESSDLNECVKHSLKSYLPNPESDSFTNEHCNRVWSDILGVAYDRHVNCEAIPDIYGTLMGWPYEIAVLLEDKSVGVKDSCDIFLSLRQRIYGILLHEKPGDEPKCVKEFGMWDNDWHDPDSTNISAIEPDVNHPGLITLWQKKSRHVDVQRWKLFARSISDSLDWVLLERLDSHYVVPLAVVFYLKYEGTNNCIEENEFNAFLRMAVSLQYIPRRQLDVTMIEVPNKRFVNLATIFSAGINTVLFLMSALGFPLEKAMPWYYYDGPVFYRYFQDANKNVEFPKSEDFQIIESILKTGIEPPCIDTEVL